jgi:membrane-associated phospholipid phosphatase
LSHQPADTNSDNADTPRVCGIRRRFLAVDVVVLGFLGVLFVWTLISLVVPEARLYKYSDEYQWAELPHGQILLQLALMMGVYGALVPFALRHWELRVESDIKPPRSLSTLNVVHALLPLLIVPTVFTLLGAFIATVSGVPTPETHPDYDPDMLYDRAATWWDLWLKDLDIRLVGVYLPEWFRQYHAPWFTGLLVVTYLSYYVAPMVVLAPHMIARNWLLVRRMAAIYIATMFLTYIGYILLPATGPRFEGTFEAWLPEEPGWFGAEWWQRTLDAAEIIRWDAFPSGHTACAVVALVLAARYTRKVAIIYAPFVVGLIVATVALGYHYVTDVIAGLIAAVIAFAVVEPLVRWWEKGRLPAKKTVSEE